MKLCGKRASDRVLSKKELVSMVVERLGWKKSHAVKTKKEELCKALDIEWVQKAPDVVVHPEKVCSSRATKAYPNRYTREELVDRIKQRHPYMNRGRLLRSSMASLCRLARIPFTNVIRHKEQDEARAPAREPFRFYKTEEKAQQRTTPVPCLSRGVKTPFQYQERVVAHFRRHRGLIAVHSVGSGKTLTALIASQCYLDQNPTHKVVVISPTSLIANFKKEMSQFGDLRHKNRYEFFSFQGFLYKYKDTPRVCRNHMLIIDEAHNLRTEYHKSKTGKETGKMNKVITRCAERADKVLLLTATPLINKCGDVAALLNMVRDRPRSDNKITRKDIEMNLKDKEFMDRAALCKFSFYERQRASDDYPRTEEEDIFLVMPPRFLAMYNKVEGELMEDDILRTFGESQLKPFYNGVRRAVNILSELPEEELTKSPKIKWILAKLREEPQKTVIFSHFLESGLQGIQNRLPSHLRSARITGAQSKPERAEVVRKYNNDEIDVLFLSKAGGEGIDLKGTRRIILLESGWNQNTEAQVIGRGVRFRSHAGLPHAEQNVTIYRLYHIKNTEKDQLDHLLSNAYEVNPKDPSTWLSADLMLKKISDKKVHSTDHCIEVLKKYSIERNPTCA